MQNTNRRMIDNIKKLWNRLFLVERPSLSLGLFRVALAFTAGSVVIPTLFNLRDNYYSTALKIFDLNFFPGWFVEFIQRSPDALVLAAAVAFCVFWLFFLTGLFSQASCILMTLCCYYFYALNSFHVGTLSWDILLVTLFLMCICPYSGDYFSLDALRKAKPDAYKTPRPYWIQRLLQLQIACTYFYTGLYKISAQGNWLNDNPIYYLMNYPPEGAVKWFLLRDFFMDKPELCYWTGVTIVVVEILMPFLLFNRRTRLQAITLGVFFHIVLILTLDVPATFFFLFPAQLFLFINPGGIVRWVEHKRVMQAMTKQNLVVYDGDCGFCRRSVAKLRVLDLFGALAMVDFKQTDVKILHPDLTPEACNRQMHLVETDGRLSGGFESFRRMCFLLPMCYVFLPVMYFPGVGLTGNAVYRLIAKNRRILPWKPKCDDGACKI